jgi:hypothetical protein
MDALENSDGLDSECSQPAIRQQAAAFDVIWPGPGCGYIVEAAAAKLHDLQYNCRNSRLFIASHLASVLDCKCSRDEQVTSCNMCEEHHLTLKERQKSADRAVWQESPRPRHELCLR